MASSAVLINVRLSQLFQLISVIYLFFAISPLNALFNSAGKQQPQETSTAERIRSHGFLAEEHQLVTEDGYIVTLTRGVSPIFAQTTTNGPAQEQHQPALAHKNPLLLVHGALETSSIFVVNAGPNARPVDNLWLATNGMGPLWSQEQDELLANDPSSSSLALLAMNMGHEVWMLHRRGTPGSMMRLEDLMRAHSANGSQTTQQQPGPARSKIFSFYYGIGGILSSITFDRGFWNYSLDEQARFDVPQSIHYVLGVTNSSRLSLVGHSAGGSLILMSLINYPELSNKIDKAVLLAPAFSLGYDRDIPSRALKVPGIEQMLLHYSGPVPPTSEMPTFIGFLRLLCGLRQIGPYICARMLGYSGRQEPIRPNYLSSMTNFISSHEELHYLQNARKGFAYRFDYGNAKQNMIAYGREQAPIYDTSRLSHRRISIFAGSNDTTVTPGDIMVTSSNLTVAHKLHFIGDQHVTFGHNGYFFHVDNARLANVPIMRELAEPTGDL